MWGHGARAGEGRGAQRAGGLRARAHTLPLPLPLPLPLLLCSLPLPLCSLSLSRPLPLHITCLQAVAAVCLAVADASEVSLTTWEVSGVRSGTAQIPPLPASTLARCGPNPPGRDGSEMQQPILGLYTAPPRLELVVWACLGPPWPSLPAEPCDPPSVGHFSLASKGTERGPHRPACGMRETKRYSTTAQPKLDQVDS